MIIKRIQVREGFLDGLDLSLSPGLNVIIGARGAGKTSIIELVRYCLAVEAVTERYETAAREHALAVLQSGEVSVTISDDDTELTITRSRHEEPVIRASGPRPIILSQNEIELVGLEPDSRLRLIDRFRGGDDTAERAPVASDVRSLTVEIQRLRVEIIELKETISGLEGVPAELARARLEQAQAMQAVQDAEPKQNELQAVDKELAQLSVIDSVYTRSRESIQTFRSELDQLGTRTPRIDTWPESAGTLDRLSEIRDRLGSILAKLNDVDSILEDASAELTKLLTENKSLLVTVDSKARSLREKIEADLAGAGAMASFISNLEEKVSHLEALKTQLVDRNLQLEALVGKRSKSLATLDRFCEDRYRERVAVVDDLNDRLNPQIEVRIERSALCPEYIAAVSGALRGSGLHHNNLARTISERISPREFGELVEAADYEGLAALTGISNDRAARICSEVSRSGTEDVITADVQDAVSLYLLDGNSYKSTENLSTGQRCTVVLPIVLGYVNTPLIVDQPEDHLDNAFIVETLVEAILERKPKGQMLFSTHNANIPVLGDADQVIHLASDGKRGFLRHAGPLTDITTVNAITSVMEGGKEAFEKRAAFYRERYARDE